MRIAPALFAAVVVAVVAAGSLTTARPAGAAFPGGNGAIAYSCEGNICAVGADGSGQTQLTAGSWPAWSPDGNLIVFECSSGICVMDADGSDRTQLTSNGWQPAWSPDGSRIAFGCASSDGDGICVMDANGSNLTQLTSSGDFQPSWSPDGTTIAFDRLRSGSTGGSDIYTMNADGSGQTQLTNGGESVWNESPDWSPDGTKIVFGGWHGQDGQIWVMNADGSGQTRLTYSGVNDMPTWSPDGTQIAFGCGGICVMDADGSDVTQLTSGQFDEPDWQPLTGTPPPFSDLRLRMAGPRRIGPGDPITYAIRVRDTGPAEAEDVVVTDPLPAGTSFVRASTSRGSCTAPDPASGAALTCSIGSMGDGSVRTIIVVCRAGSRGTVANTAMVGAGTPDPDLHDNSATLVTTVR
jgi:uncharacterized repeat protein (TIGR01451 family)